VKIRGRRCAVLIIGLIASAVAAAADTVTAPAATAVTPLLTHIRVATVTTDDLEAFTTRYTQGLGYLVRERGRVSRALAASWGAPRVAGRGFVLLSSAGWPDVYLRAIEAPAVAAYHPMTTFGWNAIEIIVDDPDALREHLRGSPLRVIGEPTALSNYPTIRAFQVEGPSREVVYLTSERGDRSQSPLPPPNGAVGRPFIMVLAGPDIQQLLKFYHDAFNIQAGPVGQRPVSILVHAQHLPPDATLPLTTGRLADHGNLIEFDGYSPSATIRPRAKGELPPGIALASFGVTSLDAIKLPFLQPPRVLREAPYFGKRAATVVGPAGELIELIED
jgi:hypothetical protein